MRRTPILAALAVLAACAPDASLLDDWSEANRSARSGAAGAGGAGAEGMAPGPVGLRDALPDELGPPEAGDGAELGVEPHESAEPGGARGCVADPPIAITEVLANPAGLESTQEYVEIFNLGDTPASLAGLVLRDRDGEDALPAVELPAGAYALIVPEGFVPGGPDPAPRAGTPLLGVVGRLGRDGLANAGEPAALFAPDGRILSSYGGFVNVESSAWNGRSVHRQDPRACDAPASWIAKPLSPTPGW